MHFSRLALLLLFLFPGFVLAQKSGWEFISGNDFTAARPAFEAALARNPNDEAALVGMIFLSETIRDHENYERYANRLLDAAWTPEYVWLFERIYTGTAEAALRRSPDGPRRLLAWAQAQADTLMTRRRFEESKTLRTSVLPDWNWAICGPFASVAGSGFVEVAAPENRPFNLLDTFKNEDGVQFSWLKNLRRKPGAPVDFNRLPQPAGLATWYANTFIEVSGARPVALRITRGEPMKIWLDDKLLLERPLPAAADEWDVETLHFDLPAGRHRLLVKIAGFPDEYTDARIRLAFNDRGNDGEYDYEPDYDGIGEHQSATDGGGLQPKYRFALRFTDPRSGKIWPDIGSAYESAYTPAARAAAATLDDYSYLNSLQQAAQQYPADAWRLYLVAKAFAKYADWETGEAFFHNRLVQQPGSDFLRFLLAKFYDANGKSERAEALLSEMDTSEAPTYAAQYIRLLKINREQEEPRYLAALEAMLTLSPTNWNLLSKYLQFLKEKGRREQIKTYVQRFLEQHDTPKWQKRLEDYLRDESYKPESYKPETDKEREKKFRAAKKRLKTAFNLTDYAQVIRYLKQKDKVAETLAVYDEVLAHAPYLSFYYLQKAAYLFEKERPEAALALVQEQLKEQPYNAALCELAGDIFYEKKNEPEALYWYRRAKMIKGREGYDLAGKIEKIENRGAYTGYFENLNLEDIAKDPSWQSAYPGEEAVIALFAQKIVYLREERKFQAVNKCVVHIRNEAGAKRWTEADLSLLGKISNARIVKKDGAVTSPDLGWGGMAVFKNLQPGDAILLEGVSERGMPDEFSAQLLDLNSISWPTPVVCATYELLLPKDQDVYFAYNRLSGQYTKRDTGQFKLLRWEWQNIPKMEEEEATPQNIDAAAWIMYSDAADWSPVVQWYLRKTYRRTEPNYEVLAQVRDLIRPGMNEDQIVETLHTYITRDINYSYVPFLNSNYIPKKPGATLSAKVGDCKDVATLMISLLRELGIPAWYTLVSTHTFSNVEPRPTAFVFNHAIVAYQTADGALHFDDLTTDYFPNGVLPGSDCDAWGLVVRDGETALRRLPNHQLDTAITRVVIDAGAALDTLGNLLIDAREVRHGVAAGHWREVLLRTTPEERQKKLTEYYGGGVLSHLNIESSTFDNLDSTNAPLRSHTRLTAYHQMDQVADLYILPLPLPLSTPTHKALFATGRYNDLDADAFFELAPVRETVDLRLPDGFRLAETPGAKTVLSPFGQYHLSFEQLPGGLRIRREVTFTQRFIPHADFQAFRQFYLDMLDADDGLLALRRAAGN